MLQSDSWHSLSSSEEDDPSCVSRRFLLLLRPLCVSVGGRKQDFLFHLRLLLDGDNPSLFRPRHLKTERFFSAERAEALSAREQER